ncbi:MAG: cupin domain-containing protein [Ruminiclostridium sp.]|nr:cupin domain-containing protein [Ruminiclostridium sp.]
MIIDFESIPLTVVPHMRDGEKEVHLRKYQDELGKIMRGKLIPGATIGLHVHDTSSEVIYILSGTGKVLYEGEYLPLQAGTTHYCPKGKGHSLINDSDGDLEFLAIIPEQ